MVEEEGLHLGVERRLHLDAAVEPEGLDLADHQQRVLALGQLAR
jgi:hypothetical protein